MEIVDALAEIIATMTDAILYGIILNGALKIKQNRYTYGIPMAIVFTIMLMLSDNLIYQVIAMITIGMLYGFIQKKGTIMERLIVTVGFVLTITITNLVVVLLFSTALRTNIEVLLTYGSTARFTLLIIDKIVLVFMTYLVCQRMNSVSFNKGAAMLLSFILGSSLVIALANMHIVMEESSVDRTYNIVIAVCMFVIDVVSTILIQIMTDENRANMENRLLLSEVEGQQNMLYKVDDMYQKTRQMKHDLKHYFSVISGLIDNQKYDEAKETINEVVSRNLSSTYIQYQGDNLINSIINEKAGLAEEQHIDFKISITGEIKCNDKLSVAIALANLLDNAMEAQRGIENPQVRLSMFENQEMYFIYVKNKIKASVLSNNKEMHSTKSEEGHGLGITSVENMVERLGGHLQFEEDKDTFIAEIYIPNYEQRN